MSATHEPAAAIVTRFAPSPTGYLHLGHAYAALLAWRLADRPHGRFLLRIEDIDTGRSRSELEEAIYEDLRWLGLSWREPVMRQSERSAAYQAALDRLAAMDVLYPCFCTRKDILAEINRSAAAPHAFGPDGPVYPGLCRGLGATERSERIAAGEAYALRLHVEKAHAATGDLAWYDRVRGNQQVDAARLGDVVLARKDIATSYHLAVTVDDAAQGVTLVTRGEDLFASTHIHRLLQALLGLDVPEWHHTPLLTDAAGKRLAKRHDSLTLRALRESGATGDQIWAMAIQNLARGAAKADGM